MTQLATHVTMTGPSLPDSSAMDAARILERNLHALSRSSPHAARLVAAATPAPLRWLPTDAPGEWSAEIDVAAGSGTARRALCSRRRPRDEARRLVETIDIADAAVFIVSGFGCGYHVEALARRLNKTGVIVVFEPDVRMLRAVLERIDCSAWLGALNVAIMTDADDTGEMARLVEGIEGLVAMGVTLVEHPASRERLAEQTRRLHERFLGVVKAVKMTVVTTMVQVKTTLSNLTRNLDAYVASPGVAELAGACAGRAAIVVSAGPSLKRNIALLEDPAVRDRVAIIAVQTVLKPLLARGIRPHFVTALDYSAISTRFYEGLTAADVEGVTLVVDPKVNPAVLAAWPGDKSRTLRVQADKHLDKLLGPDLTRDKGALPAGATVAHLAYYLARHLGCDPVALIGQDLGFTDGQYYSAGAAIHQVWACELNEFNTLEMLEWQRILRMGTHLRSARDTLGRSIYTDEQMATYLVQFERDFKTDAERGLTTIDATEGGVLKQHTQVRTLAAFLAETLEHEAGKPGIDELLAARARARRTAPPSLRAVHTRVRRIAADARRIAELSRQAGVKIAESIEHHADRARVDRLIVELERLGSSAASLQPAFDLTQTLNQTGVFNRLRADRALQVETNQGSLTPVERQRRQLERDAENVRSLATAADELAELLDHLDAPALSTSDTARTACPQATAKDEATARPTRLALAAVLPVLGDPSHFSIRLSTGRSVLAQTVHQLLSCPGLDGRELLIAADEAQHELLHALLGDLAAHHRGRVRVVTLDPIDVVRRRGVLVARASARACWRGGLANQSVYDEVFDPAALRSLARTHQLDAILLVGPDWSAVEPSLCDQILARHATNPEHSRFTFTQAPPGLCGCVLSRSLLEDFAAGAANTANAAAAGVFASIGGLLGYIPFTPIVDLINLPECVAIDPGLRDCWDGERFIADTPRGRAVVEARLAGAATPPPAPPSHLVLEIASDASAATMFMPRDAVQRHVNRFVSQLDDEPALITLRSTAVWSDADPLDHPDFSGIIAALREVRGAHVHIRTPLTARRFDAPALLDGMADIISIDLAAESQESHRTVTGRADAGTWTLTRERLQQLIIGRHGAWSVPWIVPRLTRCDATYGDMDAFYRPRLIQCGAAIIDPLDAARPGERIEPLPIPETARRRMARTTRVIGIDGVEKHPW